MVDPFEEFEDLEDNRRERRNNEVLPAELGEIPLYSSRELPRLSGYPDEFDLSPQADPYDLEEPISPMRIPTPDLEALQREIDPPLLDLPQQGKERVLVIGYYYQPVRLHV